VSDRWREGQKILLCTDGLTDLVSDAVIEEVLQGRGTDQQKVNRLIEIALANGGKDNVTVVLVSAPDSAVNPESDTEYPDTGKSTNSSQTRTASSG
ncbi:MAG: hypothetical protein OEZ23_01185, partial [Gammaproteobacteria bacterium]|nr:hypothetical protein [Gammaproteobacteria bacterium]